MTREQLIKKFDRLTVWRRRGERAPHKPLLLLFALGVCLRGTRFIAYSDADDKLGLLLREFGPPRKSYHTEYPFWRLQNDGLWELRNAVGLASRRSNTDPRKSELLRRNVEGGFTDGVYRRLRSDPQLALTVAHRILDAHFPSSLHDDILAAVGIEVSVAAGRALPRDPEFRHRVLQAYEYACAVCGFDVRLANMTIALEAAHIKWHQAGGPATEPNGVALCSMHHKLFDHGAFTVSEDRRVLVSELAHGRNGFHEWLMTFHGHRLRQPVREEWAPASQFSRWHVREVFKGAPRPELYQ